MELRVADILKINEIVLKLAKINLEHVADNYKVFKLMMKLEPIVNNYKTQLNKIIERYGVKDEEKGFVVRKDSDNYRLCVKAISELENLTEDMEIPLLLTEIERIPLCAADLMVLNGFGIINFEKGS